MAAEQPGLAQRLAGPEARRIASQHRQLDDLYALVRTAIDAGEPEQTRERLGLFAGGVRAHFALEESFYFPALHGLRPALAADLARLEADHRRLREALAALEARAAREAPAALGPELEAVVDDLRSHEAREEALVGGLRERG